MLCAWVPSSLKTKTPDCTPNARNVVHASGSVHPGRDFWEAPRPDPYSCRRITIPSRQREAGILACLGGDAAGAWKARRPRNPAIPKQSPSLWFPRPQARAADKLDLLLRKPLKSSCPVTLRAGPTCPRRPRFSENHLRADGGR